MAVVHSAKDFITSEVWPYPKLPCVNIWKGFAQNLLRYGQKIKSKQGQGHSVRSSVKVTKFQSTLRLLLMNKYEKFEDNAIARFCCSMRNSKKEKKRKKNPKHGNQFNNNIDREYLSVNNDKKELDENQESSHLLR